MKGLAFSIRHQRLPIQNVSATPLYWCNHSPELNIKSVEITAYGETFEKCSVFLDLSGLNDSWDDGRTSMCHSSPTLWEKKPAKAWWRLSLQGRMLMHFLLLCCHLSLEDMRKMKNRNPELKIICRKVFVFAGGRKKCKVKKQKNEWVMSTSMSKNIWK